MLHVGSDSSTRPFTSAPVQPDGTFRYIPISERNNEGKLDLTNFCKSWGERYPKTYREFSQGGEKIDALPEDWKYWDDPPHVDPDPVNFTHSEPLKVETGKRVGKRNTRGLQLERLSIEGGKDGYLFFVASLVPIEHFPKEEVGNRSKYVLGFLRLTGTYRVTRIKEVTSIEPVGMNCQPVEDVKGQIERNAHCKYVNCEFVCAVGMKEDRNSVLLKHAVRLTEPTEMEPFSPSSLAKEIYAPEDVPWKKYVRGLKWLEGSQVSKLLRTIKQLNQS